MRCVDCEKHRYLVGHWCEANRRSRRISDEDAYKDVPCDKGERKE